MAVQVLCVQMSSNHHLKSFAPHFVCKFHSDFLCKLRGYVLFLKAQVSVIGLNAVVFAVCFFTDINWSLAVAGLQLIPSTKTHARFFFVLCIAENITESLILFLGVNVCRRLFGIGGIVDYLTEP